MSDVQDFIKEKGLQPTRSTLAPYAAEILELRELGFSYRVIAEFLHEKKGLKTSFQNVAAFIRSYHAGSLKTVQTVEIVNAPIPTNEPPSETQPTEPKPKPPLKKGIKKFDWKNATTEGLI